MRSFSHIGVVLLALSALLLSGCVSSTGAPGNETTGTIQGYAYSDGSVLKLSAESAPPTGFTRASGVTFTLAGTSLTATSDVDGHYSIAGVASGVYNLTAVDSAGLTLTVSVTVTAGQTITPTGSGTPVVRANIEGYVWQARYTDGTINWDGLMISNSSTDCVFPYTLPAPNNTMTSSPPALTTNVTKIYIGGVEKGQITGGHFRITDLPIIDGTIQNVRFGDGTHLGPAFNVKVVAGDNLLNIGNYLFEAPWQATTTPVYGNIILP